MKSFFLIDPFHAPMGRQFSRGHAVTVAMHYFLLLFFTLKLQISLK